MLRVYPVLVLIVLAALLSASCGGKESRPTPTETSPTPSVSEGGPAEKVFSSGSRQLILGIGEEGATSFDLKAGDLLRVTFKVMATGGFNPDNPSGISRPEVGIAVTYTDQSHAQVFVKDTEGPRPEQLTTEITDTFEVVAQVSAPYELGFTNFLRLRTLTIDLEYVINPPGG